MSQASSASQSTAQGGSIGNDLSSSGGVPVWAVAVGGGLLLLVFVLLWKGKK